MINALKINCDEVDSKQEFWWEKFFVFILENDLRQLWQQIVCLTLEVLLIQNTPKKCNFDINIEQQPLTMKLTVIPFLLLFW